MANICKTYNQMIRTHNKYYAIKALQLIQLSLFLAIMLFAVFPKTPNRLSIYQYIN